VSAYRGLRPAKQANLIIPAMKQQAEQVRTVAAMAIQRKFRYVLWKRNFAAGIAVHRATVAADKALSKGMAAVAEAQWGMAQEIFESGLKGSPQHLGLKQAAAKAKLELELADDSKGAKARRKAFDSNAEAERKADAEEKTAERLARRNRRQEEAEELMAKIESGEWETEERERKQKLAEMIAQELVEKELQLALKEKQAKIDAAEAIKTAKLEAKQKRQEEKQAVKDAKLEAKLEKKQAKEQRKLNDQQAKAEKKAANAEAKAERARIKSDNKKARKSASKKSKQLRKAGVATEDATTDDQHTDDDESSEAGIDAILNGLSGGDEEGQDVDGAFQDEDDPDEQPATANGETEAPTEGSPAEIEQVEQPALDDTETAPSEEAVAAVGEKGAKTTPSPYDDMSKRDAKQALKKKGLSLNGSREVLVARLKRAAKREEMAAAGDSAEAEIEAETAAKEEARSELKVSVAAMKVSQLKKQLEERGLDKSGKKMQLMERLTAALEAEFDADDDAEAAAEADEEGSSVPGVEDKAGEDGDDSDEEPTVYDDMAKKHLKAALAEAGLKTTGTKKMLVKRMLKHDVRMDRLAEAEQAELAAERAEKEAALEHLSRVKEQAVRMRAPQLRKELKKRGLETDGKKAALMERLACALEEEEATVEAQHVAKAASAAEAREIVRAGGEDPRLMEPEPDWEAIEADALAVENDKRERALAPVQEIQAQLAEGALKDKALRKLLKKYNLAAGADGSEAEAELVELPMVELQSKLSEALSAEVESISAKHADMSARSAAKRAQKKKNHVRTSSQLLVLARAALIRSIVPVRSIRV